MTSTAPVGTQSLPPPGPLGRSLDLDDSSPRADRDEASTLAALRLRRADAWEALVRAQLPRLLAVAGRILRDEEAARDAVQEAFVAAFRHLDRFAGQARISTWLHRITVNAALMRLRSRRARPEASLEMLLPGFEPDGRHSSEHSAPQEERLLRGEVATLVRRAIDRLPDAYRTVVLLRDIEELDTASTAELLGVSTAAVKVRLHRARQALRTLLEPCLAQAGPQGVRGMSSSAATRPLPRT